MGSNGIATTVDGKELTMGLNANHAEIIEARGIDAELAVKLGVTSSDKGGDWIEIPYLKGGNLVNRKFRTIAGEKRFYQEAGATKCLWNVDSIHDETLKDEPLIITEGEFDALAAMQAGFQRVVSVPDGAPAEAINDNETSKKYSYLDEVNFEEVKEIIICADGDPAGANLLHDLSMRLGKARCKWVKYPKNCKDLNDALKTYGLKGVTETINRAKFMEVKGVYLMSELPPLPMPKAHDIGIIGLDTHYRVRFGDFCVITGIPSHGKTSLVNEICGRLAISHGYRSVFASFEQAPQNDHKRNLRTFYCKSPVKNLHEDDLAAADKWIEDHFAFIVPSDDDDVELQWVLERCAASVIRYQAKIIVIDPWNEMDHIRPPGMTLTEYTGFAIKQFKKFAKKYQVHLIVCAHPAKQKKNEDGSMPMPTLYDISDSAHWYNKADVGVVVHRKSETETIIRVQKSRYHDQIGVPGEIVASFNRYDNRFIVDELKLGPSQPDLMA